MARGPALFALLLALAACGSRSTDSAQRAERALPSIKLTSTAFSDGAAIPAEFTCDGKDRSPPLSWSGAPPATRSFALIVSDPDAPGGNFRHWGSFDIPANLPGVNVHYGNPDDPDAIPRAITGDRGLPQATNDMGKLGYSGPCPPKGHGPHHYRFTLMALDVPSLGIKRGSSIGALEAAAKGHVIATGRLTGTYERR